MKYIHLVNEKPEDPKLNYGTLYSNSIDKSIYMFHSPYEAVDMGLPSGTKWASMNVGATAVEETGLFFAYGDTDGIKPQEAKTFDWANYKYCEGTNTTLTKYNTDSSKGVVDGLTELEDSDDPAKVIMGGDWRTPTNTEWNELLHADNSESWWVEINGVYGKKIVSTHNGNYIFVPACGYREGSSLISHGTGAAFLTKNIYADDTTKFYEAQMTTSTFGTITLHLIIVGTTYRYRGCAVRAVC